MVFSGGLYNVIHEAGAGMVCERQCVVFFFCCAVCEACEIDD